MFYKDAVVKNGRNYESLLMTAWSPHCELTRFIIRDLVMGDFNHRNSFISTLNFLENPIATIDILYQ